MINNAPGYLTIEQRLQRLQVRLDELSCWHDAETLPLGDGWTLDGAPIRPGDAWPDRHGVHTFANPRLEVPAAWPLDRARLAVHLGGEGLVRFTFIEERQIQPGYVLAAPCHDNMF